ncbi:DHA2 family efflux MFS transporter permease subunit [Virgibacillus halodenitrificans]|uniref:DHA2 family efflux MFS transporter permease subunit n=1 Tax=Virgibacillus halodenitrificans TaxID=1482 RepID=UPI00045C6752|nr:DHA2 family efflux MFS transporter permease subunit [Virgibacillus halodenitrificans]MCG1029061.1 DHA2 family efflux MFS transporter permease subunit [Virgibacillus halodenitrificans]MEC2160121.1 DHA2 family efflux MFS transporter permease subunit [Virgibacillus halodenitrificans]WHX27911.1 DHA2 family efflux MFS transporter permease subunit [Virgibacillus halodenitrificans]CDQ35323.1 Multidrug resistance protein B [Virgibacillus halodenitrificans]
MEADIKKMHQNPPYGMIIIMFIGAFVALLNNTLLNVAIPTIMEEFEVSPSTVQWITTGYMLVNGILIPASAFFIQRFTNRKLFLTAMMLFSLGTALAMLSPTFGVLVFARMVQASGSAIMMPLLMNVMLTAFPVEKRGTAMGFFGLAMITAPAIGPTLSGYVVEHHDWRVLFGIVLPFAIFTLIYAFIKLKNITPNKEVRLNVPSLILSSIGFGGILYGFSTAGDKGWDAVEVYGTILVGAIALTAFVIRQLRVDEPMLEFRIYRHPMFALASVISVVLSMAMFSGMILTPLYVQTIRGISPFESGLLMLPGAIVMGIMSPITGRLFDKFGARILAIIGLTITVITTYQLSKITFDTGYYTLMAIYTVRMLGISMVMMPVMTNGLNQLPMHENPHGTAMNSTLQQISGAIGSALLLTVMDKRTESAGEELYKEAMGNGNVPQSPDALAQFKMELGSQAMLDGIQFTFFISTLIAIVALILAFFIKRVTPPKSTEVTVETVEE